MHVPRSARCPLRFASRLADRYCRRAARPNIWRHPTRSQESGRASSPEHRACWNKNSGKIRADRAHKQCRGGFVASSQQHATVRGIGAQQLFGLHGQEIAIHHRGWLLKCFAEGHGGHLHREAAGLPHAALYIFRALAQMAVAGIDVAPGVDDGDDRLAGIIGLHAAHGSGARTMPKRTQVVGAIPAIAAERFWILERHRFRKACILVRAVYGVKR